MKRLEISSLCILFIIFAYAWAQDCTPIPLVPIPDVLRRDCYSWPDASETMCHNRGCVWCQDPTPGIPWCYYNDLVCPSTIPEEDRQQCGLNVGSKEQCLGMQGCMWCETPTPDVPFCFRDNNIRMGGETCPIDIPEGERVDCHPEPALWQGPSLKDVCLSRGCYYCDAPTDPAVPICFAPPTLGYFMANQVADTPKGFTMDLHRVDYPSWFGNDVQYVTLDIEYQTDDRLRLKFYDPASPTERWESPTEIESPPVKASNPQYSVTIDGNPMFNLQVTRVSTGAVIFDTSMGGLQLADQFLQISTKLDSDAVYGFGEQEHERLKHDMNYKHWGMWARDSAVTDSNLYGVHPYYLNVERSGDAHSVLFLNTNAQDVTLMPGPGLTYRTIGGVLDIYLFLGPSPGQAVQQYQQAVGLPLLVPYWSLGFQLSRWGFADLTDMKNAVDRTKAYNIPLDVVYGDIDYMDGFRDFTINETSWNLLPLYVVELDHEGVKFVTIMDPGIDNDDQAVPPYPPYLQGETMDIWIKQLDGSTSREGVSMPGTVYFPDFTLPTTLQYWADQCTDFHDRLMYAGLWIDRAEAIYYQTLCGDDRQDMGMLYNTHSVYGWSMAQQSLSVTRLATGKRSLVLSRSTYTGSGQWAAHWLGDNYSTWTSLKKSIVGMLEFSMFGYPLVGADICGFSGDTTEELCMRWQELGAFYPFSRNHNGRDSVSQDPGMWPSVANATRNSQHVRYTLLPYLYTLFYHAHTSGATVARPLFFEFPEDSVTLDIDEQFMWGSGFMICPVLQEGENMVLAYFPFADWYRWEDGHNIGVKQAFFTVVAPNETIPLFVRGGHILPIQQYANSTKYSHEEPMGFIAALDSQGRAAGDLYFDDGETIDPITPGEYFYATYAVDNDVFTATVLTDGYPHMSDLVVDNLRVFGHYADVQLVRVNGALHQDWDQTPINKELRVNNMAIQPNTDFTISWT